jgi:hypothetical protein
METQKHEDVTGSGSWLWELRRSMVPGTFTWGQLDEIDHDEISLPRDTQIFQILLRTGVAPSMTAKYHHDRKYKSMFFNASDKV